MPAGYLPADYFEGVISAGGIAVLLPPQPVDPDIVSSVLDSLHALVVTGGGDLDPPPSGQGGRPTPHPPPTVRSGTRPPTNRAATVTRGNSRCCAARWTGGCRCWGSAAAHSCSTSRSVARCTRTCPTSSGTAGIGRATVGAPGCECKRWRAPGWPHCW